MPRQNQAAVASDFATYTVLIPSNDAPERRHRTGPLETLICDVSVPIVRMGGAESLRCFFVQECQRVVKELGHRCGVRLLEVPRIRISQTPKAQRQNHCVLGGHGRASNS